MRGLCATLNHELIVDGIRTSTAVLCSAEKCTQARMMVNSCYYRDLEDGRFLHESGIGVTSWDLRFPKFATMLVQDGMFAVRAVAAFLAAEARPEL